METRESVRWIKEGKKFAITVEDGLYGTWEVGRTEILSTRYGEDKEYEVVFYITTPWFSLKVWENVFAI